jgi:hypothetical protein
MRQVCPDNFSENRHADRVGGECDNYVSFVPGNQSKPGALPEERVREFEKNMDTILDGVDSILASESRLRSVLLEYGSRFNQTDERPSLLVINGCTACRGYCCRGGGDRAFLTVDFFAWQMLCDPTLTKESLRSLYANRLPEFSVEDSCVFHGETGCLLPRSERSNLCNEFHCIELADSMNEVGEQSYRQWVAISHDGDNYLRVSMMADNGLRRECDYPLEDIELQRPKPNVDSERK